MAAYGKAIPPLIIFLLLAVGMWAYDRGLLDGVVDMGSSYEEGFQELIKTRPVVLIELVILVLLYTQVATIQIPKNATAPLQRAIFGTLTIMMITLIYIWLELVSLTDS